MHMRRLYAPESALWSTPHEHGNNAEQLHELCKDLLTRLALHKDVKPDCNTTGLEQLSSLKDLNLSDNALTMM